MNTPPPTIIKTYNSVAKYAALPPILFAIAAFAIPFLFAQGSVVAFIMLSGVALCLATICVGIAFLNLNQQPDVSTTELGLFISYNLGRVFLPWESITLVYERNHPFFRRIYIASKALPWFYHLNGLGRTEPAFLLNPFLSNREVEEIFYLIRVNGNAEWKLKGSQ